MTDDSTHAARLHGYYINLDPREDRRAHFEAVKARQPLFRDVQRLSAIRKSPGRDGCTMSHIVALARLLEEHPDDDCYAVIEDDFCFLPDKEAVFAEFAAAFAAVRNSAEWHLIHLTPHRPHMTHTPVGNEGCANAVRHGFERINNCQSTTGYIIKRAFVPALIECFTDALMHGTHIDQHWKPLQNVHVFIGFTKKFGSQLPGFSDIESSNMDYTWYFNNKAYNPHGAPPPQMAPPRSTPPPPPPETTAFAPTAPTVAAAAAPVYMAAGGPHEPMVATAAYYHGVPVHAPVPVPGSFTAFVPHVGAHGTAGMSVGRAFGTGFFY